ncbi:MAG: xylulokinase [Anaerolineales bacterium]|jgi:xylulokinase
MTKLLGIDLGTSSVKVLITDTNGNILGRGRAGYPMYTPQPDWVEQSTDDWWQAAVLAVRQATSQLKNTSSVAAISLSGQMHGTVLLDEANHALHPAVIWPDQRSTAQIKEIVDLFGEQRWIEITGSMAATGFQSATLRWFQQNRSETWKRTHRILLPKDYLRWRLCREFITDPSDAAGTGLLDGERRNWSKTVLTGLQVGFELLPSPKPSIEVAGYLIPEAARAMGLPGETPVVVGAADTAASLLGAGITTGGDLLLTISTGGQLVTPSSQFVVDRLGRLHTFCSALEPGDQLAGWYLMGATLSAGQSLRWLRENILNLSGADAYDQMLAWAEQAPIGADGLVFLPYLSGERVLPGEQQAQGAFAGLTIRHGRAELVRAVLEGVVFSLYEKYLVLMESGLQPGRILMAGGGSRSGLWMQIVADVFGLPVYKLAIEEQSAFGAAIIAGVGIGISDLGTAARDWVKFKLQIDPNLSTHNRYQELLMIYREIYQGLHQPAGLQ